MDINKIIKKVLKEATSESGSRGSYIAPLMPGIRKFKNSDTSPFTIPVSKYDSPMLEFDSYDGKMDETKKQIKKLESKAKKVTNYIKNHPYSTFSDDDGNNINPTPGKNKKIVPIKEDLAVWFGTKKKPKGSKQPKGPWVNICRRDKNGKHPPCGRPEAGSKGYPKCRAAGVAGKMSDSQKRAACQQKRKAEKQDTQTGKGQKPIMTSYKPKNESMKKRIITLTESDITRIVNRILSEETSAVDKDGLTIYKGKLSPRKMYYAQESTNLTEEEYDGLVYGYTRLGDKIVKAKKYLRYGDVTLHCAELNSGNKDKIVTYQPSTFYETRFVDMEKQKDSDIQWLKPFCFIEKLWKKVKLPKY